MGNWFHDSHLQLSSLQIRVWVLYCGTVIHDHSSRKTDVAGGNNENNTKCLSSRFFKTNLTKCAVIWVKKSKKGRFRKPEKLHYDSNKGIKGKEKKKERGDGKEKRKKQWLHSWFYNGYFGEKNCWTQKVNLAITLSKIRLDTYICICIQERNEKKKWLSKKGYTRSHAKETYTSIW